MVLCGFKVDHFGCQKKKPFCGWWKGESKCKNCDEGEKDLNSLYREEKEERGVVNKKEVN